MLLQERTGFIKKEGEEKKKTPHSASWASKLPPLTTEKKSCTSLFPAITPDMIFVRPVLRDYSTVCRA